MMKKNIFNVLMPLALMLCMIWSGEILGQCPPTTMESGIEIYRLDNQQEIDNFLAYPNCTNLPATVLIIDGGLSLSDTPITNLNALSNVVSIDGGVLFIDRTDDLINLEGLNNLTSLGRLHISNHSSLQNIDALSNVTTWTGSGGLGGPVVYPNTAIGITNVPNLSNLNALSNLPSTLSSLVILNTGITNLDVFSGVTAINPSPTETSYQIYIYGNALVDVSGISNVTTLGSPGLGIRLSNNPLLSTCDILCPLVSNNPSSISGNLTGCNSISEICTPACPSTLSVINNPVPDGIYEAVSEVNSAATVPANATVTFRAGDIIHLQPGFSIDPQVTNFEAYIQPGGCN